MEFGILGPLEALSEGRPVPLGGGRQRALLAALLLRPNEVVSVERLLEELWGESPPATAAKVVQLYVSRLRKQLGAGVLSTQPPGYVLRVDPERVDAGCFERMLEDGRRALGAGDPRASSEVLRAALSLWRGPALADFAHEPFAQHAAARLQDLRLAAFEERIEADLALGRHAELVGELESLIAEHPFRERLRCQLMVALYRCGRQAEALAAYQDARRVLVDELGIEPSPRLRGLEGSILRQAPELDAPPAEQPAPQLSRGAFVGRARELAELVAALGDALAGRGRLVLLAGEPGIGKTRLADELAEHARARGAQVLVGRSWEAGGAPAYWPWLQSLRACIRETKAENLRAQLGAGATDLAQLVPELRELVPGLPEPPGFESEGARFRLFEATSSFLHEAARNRPIVLVLDDLHAADEPSLLLLQFVARELADSRLLLVCAFRDVDPTMQGPLVATVAQLLREPQARQITLTGLTGHDVATYIEQTAGLAPAAGLVAAIQAETEGNPLFVAEVVRLLVAEGRVAVADAGLRIPPGVRAVIRQRVARLSDRCQDVLVLASVLGREFGLDALAQLGELPGDELLDVLDEAMTERVVGDVPGSPERLRFAHALIRDTLYDELTPARRLKLHWRAGEALETVYAADLTPHLAELAHHYLAAAPAGGRDRAIEFARRAGEQAASQLAYEEAARHYELALTLVADDIARCELLLALGDAQARAGDTSASKRAFRDAAELAASLGLVEQLAVAAFGYGGRMLWEVSRDDEYHLAVLERAIAAVGEEDSPLRVRLLARLAGGPLRDSRFAPERKAELSRQALETGGASVTRPRWPTRSSATSSGTIRPITPSGRSSSQVSWSMSR